MLGMFVVYLKSHTFFFERCHQKDATNANQKQRWKNDMVSDTGFW